jgi:hypothetical protein
VIGQAISKSVIVCVHCVRIGVLSGTDRFELRYDRMVHLSVGRHTVHTDNVGYWSYTPVIIEPCEPLERLMLAAKVAQQSKDLSHIARVVLYSLTRRRWAPLDMV